MSSDLWHLSLQLIFPGAAIWLPQKPDCRVHAVIYTGKNSLEAWTSASIALPATTPAGLKSLQKEGPHRCCGLWNHLLAWPSLSIFLRKRTYDERRGQIVSVWIVTTSTACTCCIPVFHFKYHNHPKKKGVLSLCHRYEIWGPENVRALSTLPLLVYVWREEEGAHWKGEDLPLVLQVTWQERHEFSSSLSSGGHTSSFE